MFSITQAVERQGRGGVSGIESVCLIEECASDACCDGGVGVWCV